MYIGYNKNMVGYGYSANQYAAYSCIANFYCSVTRCSAVQGKKKVRWAMFIEIPDDKIRHILMDLTLANTVYADVVKNAIEQALATEKADTKYVDELIAHSDDTTCYNAYQFITGVENRRRLLNHLNRIQETVKYE